MTIKKQGFVAILDVLGFSDLVGRDAEVSGLDKYINTVVEMTSKYERIETILFSDTVVLYTKDDEWDSFVDIISFVSHLLYSLFMEEIPIRGAIARGNFFRSDRQAHGTVIAGRPIIEAHYFESQLQWTGVMLAQSVLRNFPSLENKTQFKKFNFGDESEIMRHNLFAAKFQKCYAIPVSLMPNGPLDNLEGFVIVPTRYGSENLDEIQNSLGEVLDKLRWLKQLAPDPRSQAKYQNSIVWFHQLYTGWINQFHRLQSI